MYFKLTMLCEHWTDNKDRHKKAIEFYKKVTQIDKVDFLRNSKQSLNKVRCLRTGWRDYLMKRTTPGSHPKKSTKIGQPYICQQTKESFHSSISCRLWAFQNHTKQAKINVLFYHFPSLGLNEPPWFWIFKFRHF